MTGSQKTGPWQPEEDVLLARWQAQLGNKWALIAQHIPGRTGQQCAQRWRHKVNPEIVHKPWTPEEDALLGTLVEKMGQHWAAVARQLPGRSDQQCLGRWRRRLDPSVCRGEWTPEEDTMLLQLHAQLGNQWSQIARRVTARTSQQCRGRYFQLQARTGGEGVSRRANKSRRSGSRRHAKAMEDDADDDETEASETTSDDADDESGTGDTPLHTQALLRRTPSTCTSRKPVQLVTPPPPPPSVAMAGGPVGQAATQARQDEVMLHSAVMELRALVNKRIAGSGAAVAGLASGTQPQATTSERSDRTLLAQGLAAMAVAATPSTTLQQQEQQRLACRTTIVATAMVMAPKMKPGEVGAGCALSTEPPTRHTAPPAAPRPPLTAKRTAMRPSRPGLFRTLSRRGSGSSPNPGATESRAARLSVPRMRLPEIGRAHGKALEDDEDEYEEAAEEAAEDPGPVCGPATVHATGDAPPPPFVLAKLLPGAGPLAPGMVPCTSLLPAATPGAQPAWYPPPGPAARRVEDVDVHSPCTPRPGAIAAAACRTAPSPPHGLPLPCVMAADDSLPAWVGMDPGAALLIRSADHCTPDSIVRMLASPPTVRDLQGPMDCSIGPFSPLVSAALAVPGSEPAAPSREQAAPLVACDAADALMPGDRTPTTMSGAAMMSPRMHGPHARLAGRVPGAPMSPQASTWSAVPAVSWTSFQVARQELQDLQRQVRGEAGAAVGAAGAGLSGVGGCSTEPTPVSNHTRALTAGERGGSSDGSRDVDEGGRSGRGVRPIVPRLRLAGLHASGCGADLSLDAVPGTDGAAPCSTDRSANGARHTNNASRRSPHRSRRSSTRPPSSAGRLSGAEDGGSASKRGASDDENVPPPPLVPDLFSPRAGGPGRGAGGAHRSFLGVTGLVNRMAIDRQARAGADTFKADHVMKSVGARQGGTGLVMSSSLPSSLCTTAHSPERPSRTLMCGGSGNSSARVAPALHERTQEMRTDGGHAGPGGLTSRSDVGSAPYRVHRGFAVASEGGGEEPLASTPKPAPLSVHGSQEITGSASAVASPAMHSPSTNYTAGPGAKTSKLKSSSPSKKLRIARDNVPPRSGGTSPIAAAKMACGSGGLLPPGHGRSLSLNDTSRPAALSPAAARIAAATSSDDERCGPEPPTAASLLAPAAWRAAAGYRGYGPGRGGQSQSLLAAFKGAAGPAAINAQPSSLQHTPSRPVEAAAMPADAPAPQQRGRSQSVATAIAAATGAAPPAMAPPAITAIKGAAAEAGAVPAPGPAHSRGFVSLPARLRGLLAWTGSVPQAAPPEPAAVASLPPAPILPLDKARAHLKPVGPLLQQIPSTTVSSILRLAAGAAPGSDIAGVPVGAPNLQHGAGTPWCHREQEASAASSRVALTGAGGRLCGVSLSALGPGQVAVHLSALPLVAAAPSHPDNTADVAGLEDVVGDAAVRRQWTDMDLGSAEEWGGASMDTATAAGLAVAL